MYKEDLTLNNIQWFIKPNQAKSDIFNIYEEDLVLTSLKGLNAIKPNHTNSYIFYIYMYKQDLALNNLQWLMCHKPNQNR